MANTATLPLEQILPGVAPRGNFGIDLANNCLASSLLPGSNIATGSSGISSDNVNPNLIKYAAVALSSANILAMNGAPVTMLAAPGAGLAYIIEQVAFVFTATATQYANGGNVTLQYATGAVTCTGTIIAAAAVNGASSVNAVGLPIACAPVANDAIKITNASAAFITGTGTAVVHIWYRIITAV